MASLLILADDLTGAMDTAVQFAGLGIRVRVGMDIGALLATAGDAAVLVADTETRHLPPGEAYGRVYGAAAAGRAAGVDCLYKKTDSVLRGNVGAELSAALAAWGAGRLPFVPAYPALGRVTRGGIHYVGGVPVAESDFGRDPFSPVVCSDVACLLAGQGCLPVIRHGEAAPDAPYIEVYDATADDDLRAIAEAVRGAGIWAGCAGFAATLPGVLGLARGRPEAARSTGRLVALCGSMHPVTRAQIAHAAAHGFAHVRLRPEEKLGIEAADIGRIAALCAEEPFAIIDAGDPDDGTATLAARTGIPPTQVRARVAASLAVLGVGLLRAGVNSTLLVTGGDTLAALLDVAGGPPLTPLAEAEPGVVRGRLDCGGQMVDMITKSGGFGDEGLLMRLAELLRTEGRA